MATVAEVQRSNTFEEWRQTTNLAIAEANKIGQGKLGDNTLTALTSGLHNLAVGKNALSSLTSGSGNVQVGGINSSGTYAPVYNITTESNRVVIGSSAVTNAYVKVAWTVVSDSRDKTNITKLPLGLNFINKLKPVSYQYRLERNSDEAVGGVRYGFLAQDVLKVEGKNPVIVDKSNPDCLTFNETALIAVLVKAVQELSAEVETLKAKLS